MSRPRIRSIAGLVVSALVLGVFTLSPVAAHFRQSTRHLGNHAWKQVVKQKADRRYLRQTKTWVADGAISGSVGPATHSTTQVDCPNGWEALGGGVHFDANTPDDVDVTWNGPMIDGDNIVAAAPGKNPPATGWKVVLSNQGSSAHTYAVAVICARAA